MSLVRCDSCGRAFRAVRWVDLRSGELASAQALLDGEARQLCWGCQDRVREEIEDEETISGRVSL